MTQHSETKNESYERVKETLPKTQAAVYLTICLHHPISRADIATLTGMRLSSVCGRVNELMKQQLIEEGTVIKYDEQTKRHVATLVPMIRRQAILPFTGGQNE